MRELGIDANRLHDSKEERLAAVPAGGVRNEIRAYLRGFPPQATRKP
jgi:hypothetical protein